MRNRLVFGAMLALACDTTRLYQPCGLPCYTGSDSSRNVGACSDGRWICDASGFPERCEGEIKPAPELCDTIDQDCDGYKDDAPGRFPNLFDPGPCTILGVCTGGVIKCEHNKEVCVLPSTYEIDETSCDGLDNDCDGIEDDVPDRGYCYTGPKGTAANEPCHPGVETCRDGAWSCENQGLPTPEQCNGGIDDDCNGLADDGVAFVPHDIVIAIDTSGSMVPYLNALNQALSGYLNSFAGRPEFRFALVEISRAGGSGAFGLVKVVVDFGPLGAVRNALLQLTMGSGAEASLDALAMTCDRGSGLGLGWRQDSRGVVLMFTDEVAQSYATPGNWLVAPIIAACLANNVTTYVWGMFWDRLREVAIGTGGEFFALTSDAGMVRDQLQQVVVDFCEVV